MLSADGWTNKLLLRLELRLRELIKRPSGITLLLDITPPPGNSVKVSTQHEKAAADFGKCLRVLYFDLIFPAQLLQPRQPQLVLKTVHRNHSQINYFSREALQKK